MHRLDLYRHLCDGDHGLVGNDISCLKLYHMLARQQADGLIAAVRAPAGRQAIHAMNPNTHGRTYGQDPQHVPVGAGNHRHRI